MPATRTDDGHPLTRVGCRGNAQRHVACAVVTITISSYGGALKRDIVQLAFEECGLAGYEFETQPEEYDSAARRLNTMLAEWKAVYGLDLGYNFPSAGNGGATDDSGLAPETIGIVAASLARRIAPTIGKTLSVESNAEWARSFAAFRSAQNVVPSMQMNRNTPRGSGSRRRGLFGPFFATTIADDEIGQ